MGEGEAGREENRCLCGCNHSPSRHSLRTITAGLDPSSPKGTSGYALASKNGEGWIVVEAGEAGLYEAVVEAFRAVVVAVDAPLHPPYRGLRDVEKLAIKKYGARLLPGGTPGMRVLSLVGYSIYRLAEEAGIFVVETHPHTVFKLLGIDRSRLLAKGVSRHVVDAIGALIVSVCLFEGEAEMLVGGGGIIVFPREDCVEKIRGIIGWLEGATCP